MPILFLIFYHWEIISSNCSILFLIRDKLSFTLLTLFEMLHFEEIVQALSHIYMKKKTHTHTALFKLQIRCYLHKSALPFLYQILSKWFVMSYLTTALLNCLEKSHREWMGGKAFSFCNTQKYNQIIISLSVFNAKGMVIFSASCYMKWPNSFPTNWLSNKCNN